MAERFAHLHLHTDRSMLDGVGRSAEYAELAADAGHSHLAITDHGNLYGLPEHRRACAAYGIKPIYGCELYVNDDRARARGPDAKEEDDAPIDPTFKDAHLVALCLSGDGWRNLLRINHDSVVNGYYYRPRTDTEFVLRHSGGLAITTACLGSQFGRLAAAGDVKKLRQILGRYRDALGDRFFVEVHVNELELQRRVNAVLIPEALGMGIEPILTSDMHYACAGDASLQDEMIAVSRRKPVDDPKAFRLEARHLYYSTTAEAVRLARDLKTKLPEKLVRRAAENSFLLAGRCDADIYPKGGGLSPPRYIRPDGTQSTDPFGDLKKLAIAGYAERFGALAKRDEYKERMLKELAAIKACGMADFYLVTADLTREAAAREIFVWTRGSGCASLVAAAIGITRVDPVRFGLLFERFVDPSRPNAPDFDLDIDSSRRRELIDWLAAKYGGKDGERIARISSLSTFGLKAAIKDVCFAVGVDPAVAAKVSAATDALPRGSVGITSAVEDDLSDAVPSTRPGAIAGAEAAFRAVLPPEVADAFFASPAAKDAFAMVGRVRGRTQHAAGFVVAPGPLVEYLPIDRIGSGDKATIVSAWGEGLARQDIGETGLMKIDLLGLSACEVVARAASMIAARTSRTVADVYAELDGLRMDFSDPDVLREFGMGDGVGIHQLAVQDQQLAKIVARLRPRGVGDLAAAIALYRPGSLDHVEEFIHRARGRSVAERVHPVVDEILRETHGVAVYQEQVMQLLHGLGGIPLRAAYDVVKAISKKRLDKIQAARQQFIAGAGKNMLSGAAANRIFDDVEKFAGYGFNKAHAVSYAILSWITAYLRAKYPTEFWCSLLDSCENESVGTKKKMTERKVEVVLRAAAKAGMRIDPPTVCGSSSRWRVVSDRRILAPLSLIPGVGAASADAIAAAYSTAPWARLSGFLAWASSNRRAANAKVVAALGAAGAWSDVGVGHVPGRDIGKYWGSITKKDRPKELARAIREERASVLPTKPSDKIAMTIERAALGFNFWLSPWRINGRAGKVAAMQALGKIPPPGDVVSRGKRYPFIVASLKTINDRKGREMAFVGLVDPEGNPVKGVCFSSVWSSLRPRPRVGVAYLVSGEHDRQRGGFKVENPGTSHPAFRDLDAMP